MILYLKSYIKNKLKASQQTPTCYGVVMDLSIRKKEYFMVKLLNIKKLVAVTCPSTANHANLLETTYYGILDRICLWLFIKFMKKFP